MGIGHKLHFNFTSYIDKYTGAHIERLTPPDITCHHMYFYAHMTTADGSKLLFSPELQGERQIYCLDLLSGDAIQLTEGPCVDDWGAEFTSDERHVVYHQNNALWLMSLDDMREVRSHTSEHISAACSPDSDIRRELYRTPEGWQGRDIGVAHDVHALVLVEIKTDTMVAEIGGTNWDFFAQNCLARPLCRLIYVNLDTLESSCILEQSCWLGHPQLRPGDPDTIMFCHEGPYDLIDARMWLINRAPGSVPRCCRDQGADIILTHEFWEPHNGYLAFVYREMNGSNREEIHEIDPDTLEETVIMPCQSFAHCICDETGRFFVGDAQGDTTPLHLQHHDKQSISESARPRNDFLYLIDPTHRQEVQLAYHGSSWSARWGTPQDAHPHPCFTADGRSILFVTDRFGHPSIQRIDLTEFLFRHPELS